MSTVLLAGAPDKSPGQRRRDLNKRLPNGMSGSDRADLRRDAEREYFGGEPGHAYLAHVEAQARKEATRWKDRLGLVAGGVAGAALNTWIPLGPTANLVNASFPDIDSGRPQAILTHPTDPKIVYVGMSGGGLWKATQADLDASGTWDWTPLTDGLPAAGNLAIGAMAMSPADPNLIVIGLGDPFDAVGNGIYRSTDGGATWTQATGTRAMTRTWDLVFLNATTLLAATNDGLKRSTDGGLTWAPVALGTFGGTRDNHNFVFSLARISNTEAVVSLIDPAHPDFTTSPTTPNLGGTLFRTSDGGATWTRSTLTLPTQGIFPAYRLARATLAVAPSDPNTLYALPEVLQGFGQYFLPGPNGIQILVSRDRGATWTAQEANGLFRGAGNSMGSDGGQSFYNQMITVDPANPDRLFAASNMALYRSEDGGRNWTQLTHWYADNRVYAHADFHASAWSKTGPSTLFLANDGGLAIVRNPFLPTAQIPTGAGGVASQLSFLDNRRNRGLQTHLVYNVGSTQALQPPDARDRVTLGLQDNGSRMRVDEGTGLAGSTTFEPFLGGDGFGTLIHPLNGDKILGSLYYARPIRTENGVDFDWAVDGIFEAGSSSSPFFTKLIQGINDPSGDTVYTFVNQKVYVSRDFGRKWTPLVMGGAYGTSKPTIRNFAVSVTSPDTMAIVTGSGTTAKVFTSADGGLTWTDRLFPANAPGSTVTTSGSSVTHGTAPTYVWIDTTNAATLYVASASTDPTKLDRLWKSVNGGATWAPINGSAATPNGFPLGVAVHVIQNDPANGQVLYAGTNFGVYQSTNGGNTWTRFGTGLPLVAVRDLWISPDGSMLRAATFGRGAFELRTGPSVLVQPQGQIWIPVNGSATLTATVTDATNTDVAWSAPAGSFSVATTPSGTATTFTAPAVTGSYAIRATSAENGSRAARTVARVFDPASVWVNVFPSSVVMMAGDVRTFRAEVSLGPVTWSSTGGTVTSGGITAAFTAPATPGTYSLKAASGLTSASGVATIVVRTRDLNLDGVVNEADFALLSATYGLTSADAGWDEKADLDANGQVNDADISLFLSGL